MSKTIGARALALCGIIVVLATGAVSYAQGPALNPYRPVRGLADGGGPSVPGGEWARLPGGREMGPPASVHVDVDGESIWAFIRCDETSPVPFARGGRFGVDCMNNDGTLKPHDTIYKFDAKGNVVKSFGAQMFIWPHGLHVDQEGNVWATDAGSEEAVKRAAKAGVKAGHVVRKFSPDGKLLMTLGEPGVAGNDERHFNAPAGVVTAPNGDVFIADGHGPNDRIVKFSKDGKFIKSWGKTGYAPGEFRVAHCISMDKRGRLFVCDRSNARIQIFDQDGKYPGALVPVRDAERDRVLGQRRRPDLRVRFGIRTMSTTRASSRGSGSATRRTAGCATSSSIRAAIRAREPAAAPSSAPSTSSATSSPANRGRACCGNTSR